MKLTPVEREILVHLLLYGDNVPSNIAKDIGRHKRSVGRSCKSLVDKELVREKGAGVYTLRVAGVAIARDLRRKDEFNL